MQTLVFDLLPIDFRRLKEKTPSRTSIFGSLTYHTSVIRAVLKYGTYDQYIFLDRNNLHALTPREFPILEDDLYGRARIVSLPEMSTLNLSGQLVFLSTGPVLHGLYALQRLISRPDAPCVGMIHSVNGSSLLPWLLGSMVRNSCSADALICSSNAGRRVIEKQLDHLIGATALTSYPRYPFRCPVIPLGIDSEYFKVTDKFEAKRQCGFDDRRVTIVTLGRFSSRTKADLRPLLIVFSEVRKACSADVRLILAGDDTQEHDSRTLLKFSEFLGIEQFVSFRPNLRDDEKILLLTAADILVAPSDNLQETFGLSIIEGMAAGLPVIAADWDGFKDTVVDGHTGILIPTYMPRYSSSLEALSAVGSTLADSLLAQTTIIDMPALKAALMLLVENPSYRQLLGKQARERALNRYHLSYTVTEYEKLWLELINESSLTQPKKCVENPFTYSYMEVFDHYSTNILSGGERVTLSAFGEWCLNSHLDVLVDIAGTERMWRVGDLIQLLVTLKEKGTVSLQNLECEISVQNLYTSISLQALFFRLLKFGLIRFVPDATGS